MATLHSRSGYLQRILQSTMTGLEYTHCHSTVCCCNGLQIAVQSGTLECFKMLLSHAPAAYCGNYVVNHDIRIRYGSCPVYNEQPVEKKVMEFHKSKVSFGIRSSLSAHHPFHCLQLVPAPHTALEWGTETVQHPPPALFD